jgi:hypothetical protein
MSVIINALQAVPIGFVRISAVYFNTTIQGLSYIYSAGYHHTLNNIYGFTAVAIFSISLKKTASSEYYVFRISIKVNV